VRATLERELKLDVDDSFVLPDLPGSALEERTFTSTYHDTPARSLARARITLRRRVENRKSVWQLKLPREGNGNARTEIEERGGPGEPPPGIARLLVAHARYGRLEPVATLRTRRSGVRVQDGARPVAEVTIDEVTVAAGAANGGFSEVEIELVDTGNEDDLSTIGDTLVRAGARSGANIAKVMRVIDLPEVSAPDRHAPLHVHLAHLLREQLTEIEAHDPAVRLGGDAEDLHRMRVATRRTRALIRATRPLLGDRLTELGNQLKDLGRVLGDVRDLDVLLEHLGEEVAALDDDKDAGRRILAALEAERDARRATLIAALEEPSYLTLLAVFDTVVADLPPLGDEVDSAAVANRALRKLKQAADALPARPSDDELHALRIEAKRARYAAELAALGRGKAAARTVEAFKRVQDLIGEHQDAVVAESRLRGLFEPETAVATGRLIERERGRKTEMRERYPDALRSALRAGRRAFG
jgi:CHAD domain-containing protein